MVLKMKAFTVLIVLVAPHVSTLRAIEDGGNRKSKYLPYIGCYPRDCIKESVPHHGNWSHPDDCTQRCTELTTNSAMYAGLTNGTLCLCEGKFVCEQTNQTGDDQCGLPCTSHPNYLCGGVTATQIYGPNDTSTMPESTPPSPLSLRAIFRIFGICIGALVIAVICFIFAKYARACRNQSNLRSASLSSPQRRPAGAARTGCRQNLYSDASYNHIDGRNMAHGPPSLGHTFVPSNEYDHTASLNRIRTLTRQPVLHFDAEPGEVACGNDGAKRPAYSGGATGKCDPVGSWGEEYSYCDVKDGCGLGKVGHESECRGGSASMPRNMRKGLREGCTHGVRDGTLKQPGGSLKERRPLPTPNQKDVFYRSLEPTMPGTDDNAGDDEGSLSTNRSYNAGRRVRTAHGSEFAPNQGGNKGSLQGPRAKKHAPRGMHELDGKNVDPPTLYHTLEPTWGDVDVHDESSDDGGVGAAASSREYFTLEPHMEKKSSSRHQHRSLTSKGAPGTTPHGVSGRKGVASPGLQGRRRLDVPLKEPHQVETLEYDYARCPQQSLLANRPGWRVKGEGDVDSEYDYGDASMVDNVIYQPTSN